MDFFKFRQTHGQADLQNKDKSSFRIDLCQTISVKRTFYILELGTFIEIKWITEAEIAV